MRVRVVSEGNSVVGYQIAETEQPAAGQFRSALTAGPGQKIHEIEVADDFSLVPNPEDIHKKLAANLPKKAAAA